MMVHNSPNLINPSCLQQHLDDLNHLDTAILQSKEKIMMIIIATQPCIYQYI